MQVLFCIFIVIKINNILFTNKQLEVGLKLMMTSILSKLIQIYLLYVIKRVSYNPFTSTNHYFLMLLLKTDFFRLNLLSDNIYYHEEKSSQSTKANNLGNLQDCKDYSVDLKSYKRDNFDVITFLLPIRKRLLCFTYR